MDSDSGDGGRPLPDFSDKWLHKTYPMDYADSEIEKTHISVKSSQQSSLKALSLHQ